MNERLTIQDLIDLLAEKHGMDRKDADGFVKEFFLLIEQALESDTYVKIKGLGTFRLVAVDSRESVNVNTGERFQIEGHTKVSFTPDALMRDTINKPFAHFETIVLNEKTILEDTPIEEAEDDEAEEELQQEDIVSQPIIEESVTVQPLVEESISESVEESASQPIAIEEEEIIVPVPEVKDKEVPVLAEKTDTETPEIKSVEKSHKEKSPVPYLIAIIIIVLLLCGAALCYVYFPDMFLSSNKKDVIEMPAATAGPEKGTVILDTITRKDTVAEVVPEIKKEVPAEVIPVPVKKELEPVKKEERKVAKTSTPVDPDSVTYIITGTKTTYTVKEGETLTRVALHFYGTKALWPYIVKHNRDIIKNPDNVPYGTKLKIPELVKK